MAEAAKITVSILDIPEVVSALKEANAAVVLLEQFVDQGNQQYVPDEDMESLMAEAETFLEHGPLTLRAMYERMMAARMADEA